MRCVVTGASGFIGRATVAALRASGHEAIAWTRSNGLFRIGDTIDADTVARWQQQLHHIDVVIHLAGLAHQIGASAAGAELQYRTINTEASAHLTHAAIAAGVKRLVFISSAKVFGEGGPLVYDARSEARPQDAYARTKWAAEQQLHKLAQQDAIELVIVRPPLVYGPDAKANFAQLQKFAALPLPLPFAALRNQRDLIGIDNLVELIEVCINHPAAAGGTWLCADAQPYSLGDMIAAMRAAGGRAPGLFAAPASAVRTALRIALGSARAEKVLGDFRLDCSETHAQLQWRPRHTMHDILSAGVEHTR